MPERRAARRSRAAARTPSTPGPRGRAGRGLRVPLRGPVRVLFLDVDGTLTDGAIGFDRGGDSRAFWIRDGLAMSWAMELGVRVVVISGRASPAVDLRMRDLGVESYGGIEDKVAVAERVLARERARWEECVMVGDDLPDVAMMKRVGWAVAVADAQPEVIAVAHARTRLGGGKGAVREVIEAILRHNGVWDRILGRYEAGRGPRAGAKRSRT